MADNMTSYIQLTIPRLLVNALVIREGMKAVTQCAGGCTRMEAIGEWYDADGRLVAEPVFMYRWNFKWSNFDAVDKLVREVVDLMFQLGEHAVMKERNYSHGPRKGRKTILLYP